ncbi:neural/ectodermal development factor IMP-L2 [Venturia canescens]|uniref:neural/ectodermal development factor IMP-L2 n=1 Tax=Venturia canescens TaxID=32260 RepID=UPI001C9C1DC1|nr:neural/ectodermal development factor IMP-L2 [Venturia canescens]
MCDRNPLNVSSCFDSLKFTRGVLSRLNFDDHSPKAKKMQLYFVNCLVGFFVVVAATIPTASASLPSFLLKHSEKADMIDSEALDANEFNEPLMELTLDEIAEVELAKKKKKKKPMHFKKYVKVNLLEGADSTGFPLDYYEVEEGQSLILTCVINAYPQAAVDWVRGEDPKAGIKELEEKSIARASLGLDSNKLVSVRVKYVVDCVTQQHAGPIHCVGVSGDNQDYQSLNIVVKESKTGRKMCSPKVPRILPPVITHSLNGVFSLMKSTVVLPCAAKGFPKPTTRWIKLQDENGVSEMPESRFTVLKSGELIIKDLQWNDTTVYKCIAESIAGSDSIETFVYSLKDSNDRTERRTEE